MIKETKKAPTIRFRGFTDDWEQRKLGDVCNQLTGAINPQTRPNELFVEYSMPAYDSGMKPNIVYGFTMNSTRKIVNESCLLINKLNVRKKRIWYIKNPTKNAVCSAEFIPLYSDNIDLLFLNYVVSRDSFTNYLEDCSSGSSNSQKRVTPDIIIEAKVFLPVKDEQLKIGRYFQKIDNLITLHQRKLDQLKTLKKYFLQNMFPAKGEKVPRIRFKGFTGDWEQRKLGNISAFITKGSTPTTYGYHWVDYGIPFFRNDSIQENTFVYGNYSYISNEANDALKRSEITAKDILIAITGEIGKVGIVPNNIKKANINQHMARVRISKEAVPYFVYQYLATGKIQNEYQKIKTGLSMPQLSLEQIRNTTILLPCYEEQFKISDYLSGLDNLITLHQRKLDQLQTMKKFMLQNMFI